MNKNVTLLTEFQPGDYGWIMHEGKVIKAKVQAIDVTEDGWNYFMEIDTGENSVHTAYFSRHQNVAKGVYPTKDDLIKAWKASYIEGNARVFFGGKIKVDIADHLPTGRVCVLFSELPTQSDPGSEISDEDISKIENRGQVVLAFNDKRSVGVVKKALDLAEGEFTKREKQK